MSMIKFFEIWHNDLFDNPEKDLNFIATEANVTSVRWRIIVLYESKMYSRKGIPFSSVILCLFVCCNFESKLGGGLEKSK